MKKNIILKLLTAFIFALVLSTNVYATEIKGDLDGDGKVTAYDAYLSLQIAQEDEEAIEVTDENIEIIDVDSDTEVTEENAQLILDYSVGIYDDATEWVENRYYYNQLDEYGKEMYDNIMLDVGYIERSQEVAYIPLYYTMNNITAGNENKTFNDVVKEVQYAVEYDNPEMFYLDRYGVLITNNTTAIKIYKTPQTKNVDLTEHLDKMENVKNNVVNSVEGLSDYDKYLKIHDYVVENTTYVEKAINDQNAYGCLIDKKSVCNGYAKAYKYLCNAAGLKCEMILSSYLKPDGKESGHAWNAVFLEGAWYYVDTTWDNTQSSKYKYFLRGLNYFANDYQHKQYKLKNLVYPNISKTDYKK